MVAHRLVLIGIMIPVVISVLATAPCMVASDPAMPAATAVTLTIDFGNGTVYNGTDLAGENVLEITQNVYEVGVQWSASLAYVVSIDGVENEPGRYWQYWVNGEYASTACNLYQVGSGDIILWNRTTSGYTQTSGTPPPDILLAAGVLGAAALGLIAATYVIVRRRS
jgi:hypothetical protein